MVDYDVVVVGSGFGGSVAALRLTEKGYRVGVLEAGRRFADDELASTSWQLRKFLWAPALGCYGIQRIHLLRDLVVLAGAGVGGGSLSYANTLYRRRTRSSTTRNGRTSPTGAPSSTPYYDQAQRMLGVADLRRTHRCRRGDGAGRAGDGVSESYHPDARSGCSSDRPGEEVDDPYFGGAGPGGPAAPNAVAA